MYYKPVANSDSPLKPTTFAAWRLAQEHRREQEKETNRLYNQRPRLRSDQPTQ